jgi:hypothetical protein
MGLKLIYSSIVLLVLKLKVRHHRLNSSVKQHPCEPFLTLTISSNTSRISSNYPFLIMAYITSVTITINYNMLIWGQDD